MIASPCFTSPSQNRASLFSVYGKHWDDRNGKTRQWYAPDMWLRLQDSGYTDPSRLVSGSIHNIVKADPKSLDFVKEYLTMFGGSFDRQKGKPPGRGKYDHQEIRAWRKARLSEQQIVDRLCVKFPDTRKEAIRKTVREVLRTRKTRHPARKAETTRKPPGSAPAMPTSDRGNAPKQRGRPKDAATKARNNQIADAIDARASADDLYRNFRLSSMDLAWKLMSLHRAGKLRS